MAPLKRQRRCRRQTNAGLVFLVALLLALVSPELARADSEPAPLQLEISMNGFALNVIGAFALMPDGRIASPRSELLELGIAVPGDGPPDELIPLHSIAGLSYVYDDELQTIELEVASSSRVAKGIDASSDGDAPEPMSGNGMVLNYGAYAAASYNIQDSLLDVNGGSLSLDARAFSDLGTLQQTGVIGTTTFSDMTALRLDTVWSRSDPKRMLTYQIGDIVSGGLNWTRPVRLGGGQVRRNFGLRPDLITMPLPGIEGSAAVPSTLDVYIDGIKSYSNKVQEGPFKIDSIPVFTNSGTAKVVLTDSTGREVESETEFYASPDMLKTDLLDFSVEAGVVRRSYGTESFDYGSEPAAVASLRYGVSDIITGEAHAEAGMGLYDAGVGALLNGGRFGIFNAAVAASSHEGDLGLFLHAGWEAQFGRLGISASSSRAFGGFKDLAAVSAIPSDDEDSADVPRALDQLSLTYSFPELQSGVGLSFIHREAADGERALILSGSYSQNFSNNMAFYATAFADFGDEREYGAFAGLSIPLGKTMTASTSGSLSKDGWSAAADVSKPYGDEELPVAWRVSHAEGESRYSAASGSVRTSKGVLEGNIIQGDDKLRANASLDGSLVWTGSDVMAGRHIHDAFAIVDAGAEGVTVEYENRYAGKTGSNGKLLLPSLNAYQKNKIAIDVADLPINAEFQETESIVVPREMSGILVSFGVKKDQTAALVILVDQDGKVIPESSEVTIEGTDESFLVGYDGQVYLTGVSDTTRLTVKYAGNHCQATFAYSPDNESQTTIGPVTCTQM
ncbi:MAG: fimbrial biogenesis outer membrane usher protein [Alphaproteobacteria bacterium]|nr:fimbrial biogenesis outer membrane usher protein [Alphaproteobacteria bacterium]